MLIRDAQIQDANDIFQWRNDPLSIAMFANTNEVSLNEHNTWYRKILENPLCKIYIGENAIGKVGVCRFDLDCSDNFSEVSINLNPEMRGKKYSQKLLFNAILKYKLNVNFLLKAKIRRQNSASLRIFTNSKFHIYASDESFFYLKNDIH